MEKRIMSNKVKIIKSIKEEHNLPNEMILDLVARNNGTISESSLKRILSGVIPLTGDIAPCKT